MLRIFNTVRQQLVREGQLGRYLGYALGEIVLIVIGILIALQIDEWADDRSERRFERKTLSQIQINLQTDHEELSEMLRNRREAAQSIDNILAIEDPDNPDENLELWLADVMQFDRFHSLTSAYEVLKSRGLDIVRNDVLRTTLGIYYDSWAREIQQHNLDIGLAPLDPGQRLDAVHPRHFDVDQDDVRRLGVENSQPRLPVFGGQHLVAVRAQGHGQNAEDIVLVVDQQNLIHGHPLPSEISENVIRRWCPCRARWICGCHPRDF